MFNKRYVTNDLRVQSVKRLSSCWHSYMQAQYTQEFVPPPPAEETPPPAEQPFPPPEPRRASVSIPLIAVLVFVGGSLIVCALAFMKYARIVDRKLSAGAFSGTSDIYSASPASLLTNLSDTNREHRQIVRFEDIPKVLVEAVISAEDKRFFRHEGFDPLRMMKAAYVDLRQGRKNQGASTLSMQLARSLLLSPDKNWSRKLAQLAMAVRLEQKLTKEQIFTYYCNQVYLGRLGTFSVHGFGAASRAYFGKDIHDLTVPEAATLAGLIQRPSYFNPWRNLDRLQERRNLVLLLMRQNGYIGESAYRQALAAPLKIAPPTMDATGAPYFVDLVADELHGVLGDTETPEAHEVYTTLDLNLQRAATEAVKIGMQNVDQLLRKKAGKKAGALPQAQVALVAIDPHTGEVKALLGGRDYTASQLNRALAKRQPGSVFKPFVYAAALNSALGGQPNVITPATVIMDEPTTFYSGNTAYTPANFGHATYGEVTVRQALMKSMNIPTVKLAQMTGYSAISNLARQAGLGDSIQPTPSIALGSYEATPLDIAGAYTIYSNQGLYVRPSLISRVNTRDGRTIYSHTTESHQVLDPRVAYLMVNLMEGVLIYGTGAGVRTRGLTVPAAGKTGTSRDGWFAGFTSQLLCVVWVGFDDNHDLNLEGAKAALPIWTEFMKRALQLQAYKDPKPFKPASGVTSAQIDPETGTLATPNCPTTRTEFFIAGTEPTESCTRHNVQVIVEDPRAAVAGR
jgi:penicillin-binding protein 1B